MTEVYLTRMTNPNRMTTGLSSSRADDFDNIVAPIRMLSALSPSWADNLSDVDYHSCIINKRRCHFCGVKIQPKPWYSIACRPYVNEEMQYKYFCDARCMKIYARSP